MSASERFQTLRELLGLTRREMADFLGIALERYKSVELRGVRVTEDEFAPACRKLPSMMAYLTWGGPVDFAQLNASKMKDEQYIAGVIRAGRVPHDFWENTVINKPE